MAINLEIRIDDIQQHRWARIKLWKRVFKANLKTAKQFDDDLLEPDNIHIRATNEMHDAYLKLHMSDAQYGRLSACNVTVDNAIPFRLAIFDVELDNNDRTDTTNLAEE